MLGPSPPTLKSCKDMNVGVIEFVGIIIFDN